jgi:hypothetical protein
MHINYQFAKHIPNLFFMAIKVLKQQFKFASWIIMHKSKLNDHVLRVEDPTSKLDLHKLLCFDLGYHNLTHLQMLLDYLSKLQ